MLSRQSRARIKAMPSQPKPMRSRKQKRVILKNKVWKKSQLPKVRKGHAWPRHEHLIKVVGVWLDRIESNCPNKNTEILVAVVKARQALHMLALLKPANAMEDGE